MSLPKGLLQSSATTIARPSADTRDKASRDGEPVLATPAMVATQNTALTAMLPPRRINSSKRGKKRVHYTIDADLIAWAEDAYHDFRRADGSRLRSASEYVAELLRLARERS